VLSHHSTSSRKVTRVLALQSFLLAVFVAASLAPAAFAEVRLPSWISDNMVLQQGKPAPVWGKADPGENVAVALGDQHKSATADASGRWKVELDPLKAGGPFEMTVAGSNSVTIHNILVGEVWVCSGQSNMEMAVGSREGVFGGVRNFEKEVAAANYPMIHLFTAGRAVAGQPQDKVEGKWVVANPETVFTFSAVGYFFGRDLHRALHVPVGLIASSWGGTPAESWTASDALATDSEMGDLVSQWQTRLAGAPALFEKYFQDLAAWEKSAEKAESDGVVSPAPPGLPDDPRSNPWRPSGLWNGMIAPLVPYAIAGAIWYQGEANTNRAYQYRKLFQTMISDWRHKWGEGEFPFLFVQLASYDQSYSPKTSWAELREAQAMALSLPKTGMAVTTDIGDAHDIHPKNKQEVGRRLALAAEAIAYGRNVVYSGPMYQSMQVSGAAIRLKFDHLGGGLVAKGSAELKGFEIAGDDRKFVPATAAVEGNEIVVRSAKVAHPAAVRYGWADYTDCNLFSKAGLPASPFRTDDWPGVTMGVEVEK
jgi:sialate O-acetylesterase